MTATNDLDLRFRPDYWNPTNPLDAILVNIKGARRREMIRDILSEKLAAHADQQDVAALLVESGIAQPEESPAMEG